jgi:hypothetical protein
MTQVVGHLTSKCETLSSFGEYYFNKILQEKSNRKCHCA